MSLKSCNISARTFWPPSYFPIFKYLAPKRKRVNALNIDFVSPWPDALKELLAATTILPDVFDVQNLWR